MTGKLATTVVGVARNNDEGADAAVPNAKHEHGGGRSQDKRHFSSLEVAAEFVGCVPVKPTASGVTGTSPEEAEGGGKKGKLREKMVGWRTLPRENEVRASRIGGLNSDKKATPKILPTTRSNIAGTFGRIGHRVTKARGRKRRRLILRRSWQTAERVACSLPAPTCDVVKLIVAMFVSDLHGSTTIALHGLGPHSFAII